MPRDARALSVAAQQELRVARIAASQHRVIEHAQLAAAGLSDGTIGRWVARGRLRRRYHGVYVYGSGPLTRDGEFLAAVLAIGDGAVLSHLSAAALLGFWKGRIDRIDVTVARRARSRKGIRVHTVKELPTRATTRHHGIPVTTAARAVLDCAATMRSDRAFRRLVHEAEVQEKTNADRLNAELDLSKGRPGAPRLRSELADGDKPTRSDLEDYVVELLRRHDFPPFETNAHPPGTPDWVEVDVRFVNQRVVIEADGGRFHDTKFRRKFDARKQAIVEAAGYRMIRLTEEDAAAAYESRTVARIHHALNQHAGAA
jgi:hypothetical protein